MRRSDSMRAALHRAVHAIFRRGTALDPDAGAPATVAVPVDVRNPAPVQAAAAIARPVMAPNARCGMRLRAKRVTPGAGQARRDTVIIGRTAGIVSVTVALIGGLAPWTSLHAETAAPPSSGAAALADGTYAVTLHDSSDTAWPVATIEVSGAQYQVAMGSDGFGDYFLSMRPFKCLEGPDTLWCHVPYPYEIARRLAGEVTDLEYDFLFVWKPSGEYGIDLWNGVYYDLEPEGSGLVGEMKAIDMGRLAVPPEAGNLRPIRAVDLDEIETDGHWLPRMRVTRQALAGGDASD
ncbi:hypothetical protein [Cognatishimia sp. F0-27]|uniref:hypothetical protein n=1 Tax=Cognatishimia sp. F0-27 TaxID=2816855 RepID=UPI001D0C3264|nr:hypothetical protein [Cognatishimia sp. F0-27]MCC1491914.1 hypothetical protein [Cognatishimia sp. F0-27]